MQLFAYNHFGESKQFCAANFTFEGLLPEVFLSVMPPCRWQGTAAGWLQRPYPHPCPHPETGVTFLSRL